MICDYCQSEAIIDIGRTSFCLSHLWKMEEELFRLKYANPILNKTTTTFLLNSFELCSYYKPTNPDYTDSTLNIR
jgi:hypothetical protein